jgi:TPR repeat protein
MLKRFITLIVTSLIFIGSVCAQFGNIHPSTLAAGSASDCVFALKLRYYRDAIQYCSVAAEQGNASSQSNLAEMYQKGWGVERNYAKAVQYYKLSADQGDAGGQSGLGWMYKNGWGVERNYAKAVQYFKLSADQGNARGQSNLGVMYINGYGVDKDYAKAIQYIKLAVDQGFANGQSNLGVMYQNGWGVERNYAKAVQYYKLAADQGDAGGLNNLGVMYHNGWGVERNYVKAVQYYKLAADQGFANGQSNLGVMYINGFGVVKDYAKAVQYYKLAADQGDVGGQSGLGWMYLSGIGVERNYVKAIQYLKLAADQGDANAQDNLAAIYLNGWGVEQDYGRAAEFYKLAADQGGTNAQHNLGVMYQSGIGVERNYLKAIQYLKLAVDGGDENAKKNLETLCQKYNDFRPYCYEKNDQLSLNNANPNQLSSLAQASINLKPSNLQQNDTNKNSIQLSSVAGLVDVKPPFVDKSQQLLLEKLGKLQSQVETLQASANTINANQIFDKVLVSAPRSALVIGNDKYEFVNKLDNAGEDSKAISETLKTLGYSVFSYQNLDERSFKKALRDFRASLTGGEEVLFFFAGHGVQIGSANYLLPIDIKGDNEAQVKDEAIELQRVLDDMKEGNSKFALAIIDACRDNPFKTVGRSVGGRGLAPTTAATGQMVMFSAGAGQQALDKLGNNDKEKNGLFTRILLKEMIKPQISVDRVLRNVRNEVVQLSKSVGHEQTPALYDQSVGDFYFKVK